MEVLSQAHYSEKLSQDIRKFHQIPSATVTCEGILELSDVKTGKVHAGGVQVD